jgi:hypothetical protein
VEDSPLIVEALHAGDLIKRGEVEFLVISVAPTGDSFTDKMFIDLWLMDVRTYDKVKVLFLAFKTLNDGKITLLSKAQEPQ